MRRNTTTISSASRAVIAVGYEPAQLAPYFASATVVARFPNAYCLAWCRDMPITLARSPRRPLPEVWPDLKRFGVPARMLHLLQQHDAERPDDPRGPKTT